MKTIHLHGSLKERFGGPFELVAHDAIQACSLLRGQLKGFDRALREGTFRVVRGDLETGIDLDERSLRLPIATELHIIPALEGAKSGKAVGKLVVGVALAATGVGLGLAAGAGFAAGMSATAIGTTSFGISYGSIAMMGVMMALGGISQMLAPTVQSTDQQAPVDQRPSFLFNGVQNSSQQGVAIPLVYGKFLTGTLVVSSGITIEKMM